MLLILTMLLNVKPIRTEGQGRTLRRSAEANFVMCLIGMVDYNKIELVVSTLVNSVTTNYRRFSCQTHYELWHGGRQCPNMVVLCQLTIEGFFVYRTFWTKFCDIWKCGLNLQLEIIVQIFRKIMQLNVVNISKSPNEYSQKIISKSGLKMDPCPALDSFFCLISRQTGTNNIYTHFFLAYKLWRRLFFPVSVSVLFTVGGGGGMYSGEGVHFGKGKLISKLLPLWYCFSCNGGESKSGLENFHPVPPPPLLACPRVKWTTVITGTQLVFEFSSCIKLLPKRGLSVANKYAIDKIKGRGCFDTKVCLRRISFLVCGNGSQTKTPKNMFHFYFHTFIHIYTQCFWYTNTSTMSNFFLSTSDKIWGPILEMH